MPAVAHLVRELEDEISILEARFLTTWLPAQPVHSPDDYQHDVKAYCVLAHAVFEEFAEEISLIALKTAEDAWLTKNFSRATVSLLLFYNAKIEAMEDEDAPTSPRFSVA